MNIVRDGEQYRRRAEFPRCSFFILRVCKYMKLDCNWITLKMCHFARRRQIRAQTMTERQREVCMCVRLFRGKITSHSFIKSNSIDAVHTRWHQLSHFAVSDGIDRSWEEPILWSQWPWMRRIFSTMHIFGIDNAHTATTTTKVTFHRIRYDNSTLDPTNVLSDNVMSA